jgi:pimeloyl-ACP methyl ester carboxylesterase
MPVVCLPGLTRATADFDDLARALTASKPSRRVIALDSRGRGQSAYDPNPTNYTPAVESSDLLAVLNVINIPRPYSSVARVAAFSRCCSHPSIRK